jgi:hypothetical protein
MHFQMDGTGRNRQLHSGNKLMQVELGMHLLLREVRVSYRGTITSIELGWDLSNTPFSID